MIFCNLDDAAYYKLLVLVLLMILKLPVPAVAAADALLFHELVLATLERSPSSFGIKSCKNSFYYKITMDEKSYAYRLRDMYVCVLR